MAALRAAVFPLSAKNRRGGYFILTPPPVRVLTRHRLGGGGRIRPPLGFSGITSSFITVST